LEKHKEIEKRRADITEFDGIEDYRSIVSEKEEEEERKSQSSRIGTLGVPGQTAVLNFTIENTSKKSLPVVLFGADDHIQSTNYGNVIGITIDKPKEYGQFLAQSMANPFVVKTLIITNTDKTGVILIKRRNATGATYSNTLNISTPSPFGQQNITQHQLNLALDGWTEFNFDLAGNSKTNIQLFH
jgi:hypothetical protein